MRWLVQLAVLFLLAGTGGVRPRIGGADGRAAQIVDARGVRDIDGRGPRVGDGYGAESQLLVRRGGEGGGERDARRDGLGTAVAVAGAVIAPPARRAIVLAWAAAHGHADGSARIVRARGPPIG